jgi:hypothetical protein
MRRILVFAFVAAAASVARADLLWDQYTVSGTTAMIQDQVFTDFPNHSLFIVGDVTVGSQGWNIESVSTLVAISGSLSTWQANVTQGRLSIFAKTGLLPNVGDDPSSSPLVAITTIEVAAGAEIKASGLGINLSAGSYWVGLTPIGPSTIPGYHFHTTAATNIGDPSAIRNPGNGYGHGTNWGNLSLFGQPANDTSLRINGHALVPEPATLAVLLLGSLAMARRRRPVV